MESLVKEMCKKLQTTYNIPAVSVCFTDSSSNTSFGVGVQNNLLVSETGSGIISYNNNVDEMTLFGLGSVSKSFASLLLCIILQENPTISWDTPLKFVLDELTMVDAYREEKICLRDVLSHKVGVELGETDFGYIMGNIKREDIIKNLIHLPVAADFRTKMMYNNFMYSIGGIVAEKLTGKKYERLLQDCVFDLLGMEDTKFLNEIKIDEGSNIAHPHVGIKSKSTPIDIEIHRNSASVAPAASICSSARDMLKFMKFFLNKGKVGDVQVIDQRLLAECWKPQFALPTGKLEWDGYVSKPSFPVTESRASYGFGWYMGTYRGYRMVAHSGELFGYDCLLTLYPDMNIGIYTNMNGPGGEAAYISNQLLHYYISDLLLGYQPWLNTENIVTFPQPWRPRELYFNKKVSSEVDKDIPSSRPIETYVGKYSHGFLGEVEIFVRNKELSMTIGSIGKFVLHPNGGEDEFRMEGKDKISFLHKWDLYSPSDWMTVKFIVSSTEGSVMAAQELYCSLFESGPVFKKC